MKTAVIFGLFVLVACLQLQANGVAAECKGPDDTQSCGASVGIPHCTGGLQLVYVPENPNLPFPACCAHPECQ